MKPRLLGIFEVAELAGVSRQAVANWRARFPDFPAPVAELRSGPVFEHGPIHRWLQERGNAVSSSVAAKFDQDDDAQVSFLVKEYVVEPRARVRLHDLIHEEIEALHADLAAADLDIVAARSPSGLGNALLQLANMSSRVRDVLTWGIAFGSSDLDHYWVSNLQRIAEPTRENAGYPLARYPSLLLMYAAGLSAIWGRRYDTLRSILLTPVPTGAGLEPLVTVVHHRAVFPGFSVQHRPPATFLLEHLRDPMRALMLTDVRFEATFDRFEALASLTYMEQKTQGALPSWIPIPRLAWAKPQFGRNLDPFAAIEGEVAKEKLDWPMCRAGLGGGDPDQILRFVTAARTILMQ